MKGRRWAPLQGSQDSIVDLQSELNLTRCVRLAGNKPKIRIDWVRHGIVKKDRAIHISPGAQSEDGAVEDVLEVGPKFDVYMLGDVRLLADGDIFIEIWKASRIAVELLTVSESIGR